MTSPAVAVAGQTEQGDDEDEPIGHDADEEPKIMAKTGRNQACPCGSGKKFKRCCLKQRGQEAAPASRPPIRITDPPAGFEGSPYLLAKSWQRSARFARMQREEPARAATFWTPDRIGALDTEEILERLMQLGIEVIREDFAARAEASATAIAWRLSEPWRAVLERRGALEHQDDRFLSLIACELWKRWCPHRPSREMLDDWMQEGYDLASAGEGTAACERWWPVWEAIRDRLEPQMGTCTQAQAVCGGTHFIFNWIQDLAWELHGAARDQPRFAALGEQLCREVIEQFTAEEGNFELNFRADLGEFMFLAGRDEEGEAVFAALIEEHPDEGIGYARLASIVAHGVRGARAGGPSDVPRAIELLEQAIARPINDPDDWDLEYRLEDLRKPLLVGDVAGVEAAAEAQAEIPPGAAVVLPTPPRPE